VRVLIAHSFYRLPGGEDRYVGQQVELLGRSHEVELLAARNNDLEPGAATTARMIRSRSREAEVERTIRRFRPDVVHLHNPYPSLGPSVHRAAAKLRVPLVATVHNYRLRCPNGYQFTEGSACRRCEGGIYANAVIHECFPSRSQAAAYAAALWIHRFVYRLERTIALFLAPSAFAAAQLGRWGIERERIRLVRNFTDLAPAASAPPGGPGLSLGRLSPEKGLDVLIRALRLAGDPPFVMLGDGPDRPRLERLAKELELRRITFGGRASPGEVRATLERARFVAFPSLWHENAPLAALEALAMGRPLVVSSMGGLPELAAGDRGIVVRAGDAEATASAIRSLHADDDRCTRAGQAALAFALAELGASNHAAALEAAYGSVLEPVPAGTPGGGAA
jgi:glycosyltransferase involved in cell wall biosynthesis